jgi:hypothetical protein
MKRTVVLAALTLASVSLCAHAGQTPQVTEARSASAVVMRAEGAIAGGTLVITGPDEYVATRSFERGETVRIATADLANGSYTFEMQFNAAVQRVRGEAVEAAIESIPAYAGTFRVINGSLLSGDQPEMSTVSQGSETASAERPDKKDTATDSDGGSRAQVFVTDVIVQGSECVGFDCVNGESFGFDTLRLKENNLRIHFNDTSNSASFPSNDWRLVANETSNGGANFFGIEDSSAGRTPFWLEAGAPSNAMRIDSAGDLGLGTATPVVEIHVADGDTPTLRLEQNGSSGWTPQTFDIAANESNFFVRDVTNGSRLVFRIKPGAPEDSIYIDSDGDIGLGTDSPSSAMHVRRTNGSAKLTVEEASATTSGRELLELANNGDVRMTWKDNSASGAFWRLSAESSASQFVITRSGTGVPEFLLTETGDLTVQGDINSVGTTNVPDYVFHPDYELMPMSELAEFLARESHLPEVPSAADIARDGLSLNQFQMVLLKKIEELTLYTLEQQTEIEQLRSELEDVKAQKTSHR